MLHLAGQLLRESLLGLKESNRTQQEQRNQLHVTYEKEVQTGMAPSLERHSVEELIQELLKAHDSRRFDAVQWLRSSFLASRQHQDALMRAMFAAFIDFIGRLDPRDLATRFERSARRKTMGNWELYGEFYRSLCETPPGTLPHIFVETFAQSYDQVARETDEGPRTPSTPPEAESGTRAFAVRLVLVVLCFLVLDLVDLFPLALHFLVAAADAPVAARSGSPACVWSATWASSSSGEVCMGLDRRWSCGGTGLCSRVGMVHLRLHASNGARPGLSCARPGSL
jgi:hypothetical protein